MADELVQQVLALLAQPTFVGSRSCTEDAANATLTASGDMPSATQGAPATGLPTVLAPLLALIMWLPALPDWLKLLVVGGVVEACRRTLFVLYRRAASAFVITVTLDDDSECYNWMMVWLSKQPAWRTSRELEISTRQFGLRGNATTVPGEHADANAFLDPQSRCLQYIPSASTSFVLSYPANGPWYSRRRISVTRLQRSMGGYYGGTVESLELRIFARSHAVLDRLLLEAKRAFLAEQNDHVSIFAAQNRDLWRRIASRPKRALDSIVLDPGIKDLLINDAREFLKSRDWYNDRGIPFRRGYLLFGAPGCGKTSIIHSLAGELGLDVYMISLSRAGMDDTTLNELIGELPEKCIALMEDIDAAFVKSTAARDTDDGAHNDPNNKAGGASNQNTIASRVSLSGLLNALDGVGAQEGRILFATTNHYDALDPALCRPGRMDVHIEFRLASRHQACELFKHFYAPRRKRTLDEASEQSDSGSNFGSPSSSVPSITFEPSEGSTWLTTEATDSLARRFAEAIPDREYSMASLQGYLMKYKDRPKAAAEDVAGWVEGQRATKPTKHEGPTRVDARTV
ncbi:P-loop containing nucleoside triphosphate hydrolase protein [Schizophyllum commune]|nr:P-loop containing nucleoside triphosphate hydrolase protein [Schizophyllum commune Loenen D]